MLVEKVTLREAGRQHTAVLSRQQGWHGNCQPLLAGMLTLKPNNGSAMLASVTAFPNGDKVVT